MAYTTSNSKAVVPVVLIEIYYFSLNTPKSRNNLWQVSEITENLMLCAAASITEKLLNSLNVACIINAAEELPNPSLDRSSLMCHKILLSDTKYSNIYQYFDEVADLIHKVSRCLLII